QQAKVLENDVLLKEPVRSDNDIDRAFFEPVKDHFLLGGRLESAEDTDVYRKSFEAFAKTLVVLFGQYGSWNQHGHLLSVHGGLERGAQSDFRFSVADVAADQAIHRALGCHVFQNVFDCLFLVRGLLEGEGRLEFLKILVRGRERISFPNLANGVQLQQLLCHFLGRLSCLLLGGFPIFPAKLVNFRLLSLQARVFLNFLELVDRYVELVAVLVCNEQKIVFYASHVQMRQLFIYADPVIHMDNKIALVQILERIEENTCDRLLPTPA